MNKNPLDLFWRKYWLVIMVIGLIVGCAASLEVLKELGWLV